jgi:hypothetical protein
MADEPDAEQWIVIRNWNEYQHYKDGPPKWVKWYTGLLHDPAFTRLPMGTRGVFAHLLLLYAGCSAELPRSTRWISRQINGHVTSAQLDSLNHAGFIEFSSRPCLEHVYMSSRPRAFARGEERRESPRLSLSSSSSPTTRGADAATPDGAAPAPTLPDTNIDDDDIFTPDPDGLLRLAAIMGDAAEHAQTDRERQVAAELASSSADEKRQASIAYLATLDGQPYLRDTAS